jgi:uncharacterized RDD family membrane protein YckC
MAPDREQFPVSTAQHVPIAFDVAGLGDRFLAALIDYAVLGAYLTGVGLGVAGLAAAGLDGPWAVAVLVVTLLPALVYFPFCELVFDGQTIGKRARGLRVMRTSGAAPSLGDLLLRWLLRPIDLWATSGLAAVVTILYTGTGQRLGDLAAGTTVVAQQGRTSLDDTLFTDLPDDYEPTFPEAHTLDRDDVETVRRILRRLAESPDGQAGERVHTLATQARQALQGRLDTTNDLDPVPFLKAVLRDYNYYRRE